MLGIGNLVKDKVNITSLLKSRVPGITGCPAFLDNGESNTDEVVQHVEVFLKEEKKATNLTGKCCTFPVKY